MTSAAEAATRSNAELTRRARRSGRADRARSLGREHDVEADDDDTSAGREGGDADRAGGD
jgi:hypothetical protein